MSSHGTPGARASRPRGRPSMLVAAAAGLLVLAAAPAARAADCASVNGGALDLALPATGEEQRSVSLQKGDVLTLAFSSAGDAIGFVTLAATAGAGEDRLLLGGASGTSVVHAAPATGTFMLRFATVGGEAGALAALCTPAAEARRAQRGQPARATRRGVAYDKSLGALLEAEAPSPPIVAGVTTSVPPRAAHAVLDAGVDRSPGPPRPGAATGIPVLEWEGARSPKGDGDPPPANLGVRLRLQPAIMVGVLAQFDQAEDPRFGPRPLSERGFLAGPVTKLDLGSGVSLDARAAWGPVDPASAPVHGADRRVLDARLANTQTFNGWRFAPSVGVNYQQETLHASEVGAQVTGAGRVDLRPEIAYRFDMDHGVFIEPKAMLGSFWDLGGAAAPVHAAPAHTDMRLKAETGVTIGSGDGTKVQVGGSVEEGAAAAPNVWSGRLQVNVPLK